jgi:hypothetical protein
MWGPAKMTCQDPPTPATTRHLSHDRGKEEKGATHHFSKCSLIKDYFKKLISNNRRAKLAPFLLQCQSLPISFLQAGRRENVSYIVTWAYKRPAKWPAFLSRLHYILQATSLRKSVKQEQSRPQQHTWNSKLFVIFPAENTAAHILHIQHLYVDWGYRFKTPIAKEAFLLPMFMLTP